MPRISANSLEENEGGVLGPFGQEWGERERKRERKKKSNEEGEEEQKEDGSECTVSAPVVCCAELFCSENQNVQLLLGSRFEK